MLINFTKMHGLGNDFMMVDNTSGDINFSAEVITNLSDRHFGVGFDQLLVVESSISPNVDFRYIIYNADGSEVSQCGNGARCFARFVTQKGLTSHNPITVETHSSVITLHINPDSTVRVDMGKPNFEPSSIPLIEPEVQSTYFIEGFEMGVLSMGNPHCVLIVEELSTLDVTSIATQIQASDTLPDQANIGFMQIINRQEIRLRVYERGSGETLACGSGACAAVVHGVEQGLLDETVCAHLTGGDATIEYQKGGSVFLSGPAEFVFEGQVNL
ncbi:MAG: diaminopimelate epimerase [Candidatus Thioglobus sp.]|jgi:diaminopimelate epimerase|nr:diaminopimelate epimerase [Candidatus Thioglobus sp.]MBT3447328.1 diaminopimelate epimerase [Candidatus Thioglobus sp.]MBT3744868.1 diaminopimelate epimerase [Candidatus Thioglobus sp.]MBT4000789.1 diaminopimelate epimerase [Candidatus Thioglobus sp.]MBT4182107.1 diaminopimelate epimerase [Candidatus Thioglobus sp.]